MFDVPTSFHEQPVTKAPRPLDLCPCGCCGACPGDCHCDEHVAMWGSCAERDFWLDVEDSEMTP